MIRQQATTDNGERNVVQEMESEFERLISRPASIQAFESISSDPRSVIEFIEKMGESFGRGGYAGCSNPSQGKTLALVMLTENLTPTQVMAKYHLMDGGKLQLRAVYIQAQLEKRGWDIEWTKWGKKGLVAEARFSFAGRKGKAPKSFTMEYTIEEAKTAGLVKPNSGWAKFPGKMLRARLITEVAVAYEPAIFDGGLSEAADFDDDLNEVRRKPEVLPPPAGVNRVSPAREKSSEEIVVKGTDVAPAKPAPVETPAEETIKEKGKRLVEETDTDYQKISEAGIQAILQIVVDGELEDELNRRLVLMTPEGEKKYELSDLTTIDGRRLYCHLLAYYLIQEEKVDHDRFHASVKHMGAASVFHMAGEQLGKTIEHLMVRKEELDKENSTEIGA